VDWTSYGFEGLLHRLRKVKPRTSGKTEESGDGTDSIDPTSNVSNISSTNSHLRAENATQCSRLDDLESALKSLHDFVQRLESRYRG
jgi:hypothetical protein